MEGTTERELEKIQGVVDTLIYKNDDSGWAVARVDLGVGEELVITGVMPYLGAGESIVAYGNYVTHPEYGPQFSVLSYERLLPSTAQGLSLIHILSVSSGISPVWSGWSPACAHRRRRCEKRTNVA